MFCNKCGTELPDDSQFCRKCGQPQSTSSSATSGTAAAVAPVTSPAAGARSSSKTGISATLIILLLIIVAWAIWFMTRGRPAADKSNEDFARQMAMQPAIRHMTTTVIAAPFVVQPGRATFYKLTVPGRSSNVRLKGHFTATGGGANDVEVFLLDDDGFVNWQNHHSAATLYNSGRVTQGTMDVTLPGEPRTYYFIVSNTFSTVSNKAVSGDVKLLYDQSL